MGYDVEIDNSERSFVAENLKDEITCAVCLCIFEVLNKFDDLSALEIFVVQQEF